MHDPGPWSAIVYGHDTEHRIPLDRQVLDAELAVVLTGYVLGPDTFGMIEIYCGSDLVNVRPVLAASPCRLRVEAGIQAAEPVA